MSKEEMIEEIKKMTVVELADLVKAIEEEFGVSAVAAAAPAAGAVAGGDAAAEKTAEKEPVKTEAENVKAAEKNEPAAQPEAEETKTAAAEPAAATPTKIRISFAGPSWLELKQGDKVLLSGIYSKGFKYDVPNERGIIVSVGRYYNVDFYVDGKLTKIASAMKQTNISLDKYILPEQKQE